MPYDPDTWQRYSALAQRLQATEALVGALLDALLHAEDILLEDVCDEATCIAPTRRDVRAAITAAETWEYVMVTPERLRVED